MAYVTDPGVVNAVRRSVRTSAPKPSANVRALAPVATAPGVVQASLARNRAIQDANAGLSAARSQALIGFGDPSLVHGLGFTVDPNTAAAAAANQFSTVAGLQHQRAINQRTLLNSLAGRGLAHSGELGYQSGEQTRAYGQDLYNAQNALLSQLGDYLNSYLSSVGGANDQYTQALLASLARLNPQGALG